MALGNIFDGNGSCDFGHLHTAIDEDGATPFLCALDKATGERLGSRETRGLVMYGMMSYMHEGRQRIILQAPGALVALSLP